MSKQNSQSKSAYLSHSTVHRPFHPGVTIRANNSGLVGMNDGMRGIFDKFALTILL